MRSNQNRRDTLSLDLHKGLPPIRILTDSAFCTNTLRNYAIDPLNFTLHPHKELTHYTNNLIKTRDEQCLLTEIAKVKSHTGVTYIDEADAGARNLVDEDILPNATFTAADPPIGGLRTWPQISITYIDQTNSKNKLTYLHSGLHKFVKAQNHTTLRSNNTIYSTILRKAREVGATQSIHGYSTAPYRARRDSLEVAWGVHLHRCSRKHGPTLKCANVNPPLTTPISLGAADTRQHSGLNIIATPSYSYYYFKTQTADASQS